MKGPGLATADRMLGGNPGREGKQRCKCFNYDRHERRQFEKRSWKREVAQELAQKEAA